MESIVLKNVSKTFGDVTAVQDLSMSIQAGEIYGLVGADGAGKTTTIRLIAGAVKPDNGSIHVCATDVNRHVERARECIGYLSQRFSLYEDLTVIENIRFFAEVRGLTDAQWRPRCQEILDFVGLTRFSGRFAGKLSGGMKQKLGLAIAMVTHPKVLLLDEPTTGVDPVTRQDFWQLIIKLVAAERMSVVLSTPYMDEAARCHRIGFLNNGRKIIEGTPNQLRSCLENRIIETRGIPLRVMQNVVGKDPDIEDLRAFGEKVHIRIREGQRDRVLARMRKSILKIPGYKPEINPIQGNLEDVFIAISNN